MIEKVMGAGLFGDKGMTTWECINRFGSVVHDGLYQNEAELIAEQHGLSARNDTRKQEIMMRVKRLQHSKGPEFLRADDWYEIEAERMAERAPA
jgi:hypothetical protein